MSDHPPQFFIHGHLPQDPTAGVLTPLTNWESRWFEHAALKARYSKDRSTKVGAVIVSPRSQTGVSDGWNGFPRGVDDDVEKRHQRPEKYLFTEHAERNAIYNAARLGHATEGCTIYCTLPPCADCARAIIQAGITRVCCLAPRDYEDFYQRWVDHLVVTEAMFREAGVAWRVFVPEGATGEF